jgi:hypothetical protein
MSSEKARKVLSYLDEWERRYKTTQEIAPEVLRLQARAKWQVEAAAELERIAPQEIVNEIGPGLDRDLELLTGSLPLPPDYSRGYGGIQNLHTYGPQSNIGFSGTSASSTQSLTFSALAESVQNPTGDSVGAMRLVRQYQELQAQDETVARTRQRLQLVFPNLVDLFDSAIRNGRVFHMDNASISVALELRTLLDQLKGELWTIARRSESENMTWETMAERLTQSDARGQLRGILIEQGIQRNRLHSDLSTIMKRRSGTNAKTLDLLWPAVVDHIYAVCGCIS